MDPYEMEYLDMNGMDILPPTDPEERAILWTGKMRVDERTAGLLQEH